MSQGLIDYLKAKKIRDETGKWPPGNYKTFSEADLKAVLKEVLRDIA